MEKLSFLNFSKDISSDIFSVFAFNPNRLSCQSIARKIGIRQDYLAIPNQVHSAKVKWVDRPGQYSKTDGLISRNPDIVLTVKVADCVPVYLYEYRKKILGLVHSGWRGTVSGIITKTIELMETKGANVHNIMAYLGPSIGICCYEVNEQVAVQFNNNAKKKLNSGKWKVGLNEQITFQLENAGISISNIQSANICTYESHECHSYRRDGKESNRMYAFMKLK